MFSTSHILSMRVIPQHVSPPCQAGARWWRALRTLPGIGAATQPERQGLQCTITGIAHGHFSRRDDDTVVQHPQASRDALASWAQHQAARMAPMYELTLLPPAVLTLVSVTRIPATKVTQVSRWSILGL